MDKPITTKGRSTAAAKVPARNREEMIAVAAYFRAEQRGFAPGDPHADWLAAAAEIDRLLQAEAEGGKAVTKAKSPAKPRAKPQVETKAAPKAATKAASKPKAKPEPVAKPKARPSPRPK